jgi:hypothetical protein
LNKRAFGIVAASALTIAALAAPAAAAPARNIAWDVAPSLQQIIVATDTAGHWTIVPATGKLTCNDNNWTLVATGTHPFALGQEVILDPVSSGWTGGCNPSVPGLTVTQDWQSVTKTNGTVKLVCHGVVA